MTDHHPWDKRSACIRQLLGLIRRCLSPYVSLEWHLYNSCFGLSSGGSEAVGLESYELTSLLVKVLWFLCCHTEELWSALRIYNAEHARRHCSLIVPFIFLKTRHIRNPHEVSCLPRACGIRSMSDAHTQLKHSFLYGLLQLVYPSISSSCSVYGIDTLTRFPLEAVLPTWFHREIMIHFIHVKHSFPASLSSFVS